MKGKAEARLHIRFSICKPPTQPAAFQGPLVRSALLSFGYLHRAYQHYLAIHILCLWCDEKALKSNLENARHVFPFPQPQEIYRQLIMTDICVGALKSVI